MSRVIVFDVNETLLDVRALTPLFENAFGDPAALSQWFGQLLQTAYVVTLNGRYQNFAICGQHALEIVAQRRGVGLSSADKNEILAGMLTLPPHPEVLDSLTQLKQAGFRLATLTNSAPQAMRAQLKNAALDHLFERMFSVDPVKKFKPHPAVYHMAAAELGIPPGQMRLVAAHNWDTTGAISAGCKAAFVARPGMFLGPLDETPDIIGADMAAVAAQILEKDRPAAA